MTEPKLALSLLQENYAICRLDRDAEIPNWALTGSFFSVTRTTDELSIVCLQSNVPEIIRCEQGWKCLKVEGPLEFSLTGILASLATPLAEADISIFAISTYDTDYLLLKETHLEKAILILAQIGHSVRLV